ncbi:membrane-associated phosphatidylinositol transfer protein 3-like [Sardina pilchardus]|uniref:membrane-associated phosphatidylinositol transfer protein 3-like n=1 Tax=Sardina pilchardus TaxID=27697 RepID=UPI002E1007ED
MACLGQAAMVGECDSEVKLDTSEQDFHTKPSRKHSVSHWRLENIAQESTDSSDDEFFDARDHGLARCNPEELAAYWFTVGAKFQSLWLHPPTPTEELPPLPIENDGVHEPRGSEKFIMDFNEGSEEEAPPYKSLYRLHPRCAPQSSVDGLEDVERKCRTQLLILVIHGGHILDSGGDTGGKSDDTATLASVLERLAHAHFQAAADGMVVRLVPCPPVCSEAFALVSHLNPYSYDESCVSSSVDHLPLAALPLLTITTPRYQDAVATVIHQANQVYANFLQSPEGIGFSGQVCLIADCIGGVLCFDALCFSGDKRHTVAAASRKHDSIENLKDKPSAPVDSLSPNLLGSKRLSKSNIDVSVPADVSTAPPHPLIRKQSDSCNADIMSLLQGEYCGSRLASGPGSFDFEVSDCFLLGCPLGLVLAMRKTVLPAFQVSQLQPACSQLFNLFYPSDPSASRLEPLFHPKLRQLSPFSVPRYQRYPLGDGRSTLIGGSSCFDPSSTLLHVEEVVGCAAIHNAGLGSSATRCCDRLFRSIEGFLGAPLVHASQVAWQVDHPSRGATYDAAPASSVAPSDTLLKHSGGSAIGMLGTDPLPEGLPPVEVDFVSGEEGDRPLHDKAKLSRSDSETSVASQQQPVSHLTDFCSQWWGLKRLDYVLFCPDVLTTFPTVALPHLFHASYWESTDAVAFILRQVLRCDCLKAGKADCCDTAPLCPSSPREKWLRRRTHVKLRNVTANHRVHDVIATEDGPQTLVGRFMYGPLDMVTLTGEKVDVFLMSQPASGRWVFFDTELTSNSGRVSYTIPANKRLPVGVYPIKMVVKGDQTSAEAFLTVLPKGMECVVFSIDGSFAASVSLMGSDPKVRAGAVDVVRHWQDRGYLIIYITGRPDMQKQRVVSWLSQHNFPQGMVFFSEGLVHDPLRQKTIFLRGLVQECHIKISAAYGSMKDMSVYSTLGLSPSQIYIVGRPSKKHQSQCQFLSEGYAAHLSSLEFEHGSCTKKGRMIPRQASFGLTSKSDFLSPSPDFLSCKRTPLLRRAMSVQQPSPPSSTTATPKPERAKSQPERANSQCEVHVDEVGPVLIKEDHTTP